jgi:hypothetical protein
MSAEGAKRWQHPDLGPPPDNVRRYPEDIGYVSRREYVAVVVLPLADQHRCRVRFALPLRTRSQPRSWCRRDALTEGPTDFGQLGRREPHGVALPPVTVSKTRRVLYQLARFLGDHQAMVLLQTLTIRSIMRKSPNHPELGQAWVDKPVATVMKERYEPVTQRR